MRKTASRFSTTTLPWLGPLPEATWSSLAPDDVDASQLLETGLLARVDGGLRVHPALEKLVGHQEATAQVLNAAPTQWGGLALDPARQPSVDGALDALDPRSFTTATRAALDAFDVADIYAIAALEACAASVGRRLVIREEQLTRGFPTSQLLSALLKLVEEVMMNPGLRHLARSDELHSDDLLPGEGLLIPVTRRSSADPLRLLVTCWKLTDALPSPPDPVAGLLQRSAEAFTQDQAYEFDGMPAVAATLARLAPGPERDLSGDFELGRTIDVTDPELEPQWVVAGVDLARKLVLPSLSVWQGRRQGFSTTSSVEDLATAVVDAEAGKEWDFFPCLPPITRHALLSTMSSRTRRSYAAAEFRYGLVHANDEAIAWAWSEAGPSCLASVDPLEIEDPAGSTLSFEIRSALLDRIARTHGSEASCWRALPEWLCEDLLEAASLEAIEALAVRHQRRSIRQEARRLLVARDEELFLRHLGAGLERAARVRSFRMPVALRSFGFSGTLRVGVCDAIHGRSLVFDAVDWLRVLPVEMTAAAVKQLEKTKAAHWYSPENAHVGAFLRGALSRADAAPMAYRLLKEAAFEREYGFATDPDRITISDGIEVYPPSPSLTATWERFSHRPIVEFESSIGVLATTKKLSEVAAILAEAGYYGIVNDWPNIEVRSSGAGLHSDFRRLCMRIFSNHPLHHVDYHWQARIELLEKEWNTLQSTQFSKVTGTIRATGQSLEGWLLVHPETREFAYIQLIEPRELDDEGDSSDDGEPGPNRLIWR